MFDKSKAPKQEQVKKAEEINLDDLEQVTGCLLYTSPRPRDS